MSYVRRVRHLARRTRDTNLTTYAAGLAYGAIFAIVPMLVLLVLLLGVFNAEGLVTRAALDLQGVVPADVISFLQRELEAVARSTDQGTFRLGAMVSLGVAIWGASGAMRRAMDALNCVVGAEETRSLPARLIISMLLAFGAIFIIGITLFVIVLGGDVAAWFFGVLGVGSDVATLWSMLRWPILVLLACVSIASLYRVAPARRQSGGFFTRGALVATAGWGVFSWGFSWYITNVESFGATWGSVAGIVILMLYLQYAGLIVLFGALIDAERSVAAGGNEHVR